MERYQVECWEHGVFVIDTKNDLKPDEECTHKHYHPWVIASWGYSFKKGEYRKDPMFEKKAKIVCGAMNLSAFMNEEE